MISLLDTDVLVDVQRATKPAAAWLESFDGSLALPVPVALELLAGSRDKIEHSRSIRFLAGFDVEPMESADGVRAIQLVMEYRLATGMGLADFMIAAQALNRSATLFTFNLRHYAAIPGLDARIPYIR